VFSTSTRNFDNRMGRDAKVYLGSAELAGVISMLGRIPTKEEYLATKDSGQQRSFAQDKEALLQKLFSTDRFRAVERWLADRRLSIEKEVAAKAGDLSLLIAQVAQEADVAVPEAASDSERDPAQWVTGLASNAVAAQRQAAVQAAQLGAELERALVAKSYASRFSSNSNGGAPEVTSISPSTMAPLAIAIVPALILPRITAV